MKTPEKIHGRLRVSFFRRRNAARLGITIVQDRLGSVYRVFRKPVDVGSVYHPGILGKLSGTGIDENGEQQSWFRILRSVEQAEVRAALKTRAKLADGHWYEVLTD